MLQTGQGRLSEIVFQNNNLLFYDSMTINKTKIWPGHQILG